MLPGLWSGVDAWRARRARHTWARALQRYIERGSANVDALERQLPPARDIIAARQADIVAAERRRLGLLRTYVAEVRAPLPPSRRERTDGALRSPGVRSPALRLRLGGSLSALVALLAAGGIVLSSLAGHVSASTADVHTEARAVTDAAPAPPVASAPAVEVAAAAPRASVLERRRVVALYGHPGAPVTGALGKYTPDEAAEEVLRLARQQAAVTGQPALGALHVTVGVAQPYPMADGSYLGRLAPASIDAYVEAARRHGVLLILDTQIGWADPLGEVRALEPYLREPFVHLALDPEFATQSQHAAPGVVIGRLNASAVNAVQDYLATLVRPTALPKKLLIVHQFRDDMLIGAERLEASPEVELVIDMDGFGPPGAKLEAYARYALAPYAAHPAIKLFYEWDAPLLSLADLEQLPTPPQLVIYQ